jgi:glutamate/tyrosine decarboxylase-like PLP-dependent enzyme
MTTTTASRFPSQGRSSEQVLAELDQLKQAMTADSAGKLSSNSLKGGEHIQQLIEQAHQKFFSYNALFSFQQAGAAKLENDVMDMCVEIMHGDDESRCNITSGGTESIFCALHGMREWAKENKPEITEPEVVAPYSIHSTFSKGAHFLGIKVVRVPVGKDFLADVEAMREAIGPNTIGIAASAPSWPYGLVDPVEALGQLALEKDLWFHVDACVGGYILPFMREAGADIPLYDFRVPGVTTISADLHKYGYAAKPCSTVLWRSKEVQQYHYVPVTDWPCGLYVSQSFVGSRPLAATAAAWAVLNYMGESGYVENAYKILAVKQAIIDLVDSIEGLSCWPTHGPLLMIQADESLGVERVVGGMSERGWVLLGVNEPPAIHLTIDPMEHDHLGRFLDDLASVVAAIRAGEMDREGLLSYGGVGAAETAPNWLMDCVEYMEKRPQATK